MIVHEENTDNNYHPAGYNTILNILYYLPDILILTGVPPEQAYIISYFVPVGITISILLTVALGKLYAYVKYAGRRFLTIIIRELDKGLTAMLIRVGDIELIKEPEIDAEGLYAYRIYVANYDGKKRPYPFIVLYTPLPLGKVLEFRNMKIEVSEFGEVPVEYTIVSCIPIGKRIIPVYTNIKELVKSLSWKDKIKLRLKGRIDKEFNVEEPHLLIIDADHIVDEAKKSLKEYIKSIKLESINKQFIEAGVKIYPETVYTLTAIDNAKWRHEALLWKSISEAKEKVLQSTSPHKIKVSKVEVEEELSPTTIKVLRYIAYFMLGLAFFIILWQILAWKGYLPPLF